MTDEITRVLSRLRVGAPVRAAALDMFPLLLDGDEQPLEPPYAVLRDAMAAGTGRVSEVSAQGVVPSLRFRNDDSRPVLLIDGEELEGCKQNRILNLSILAPARRDIEIPVSCVEMGRWHSKSSHFRSSGRTMYAGLRASKMSRVSASLAREGSRHSDQGEIWESISSKSRRMGSQSRTQAMSGLFEERERQIEHITAAFSPQPRQVGAVFALRGKLAGLEMFDAPQTMQKYLRGIVEGYALEALDTEDDEFGFGVGRAGRPAAGSKATVTLEDVRELLARIASSHAERFPAVGLGEDLRIEANGVVGAALVEAGRVVHLCAFARACS